MTLSDIPRGKINTDVFSHFVVHCWYCLLSSSSHFYIRFLGRCIIVQSKLYTALVNNKCISFSSNNVHPKRKIGQWLSNRCRMIICRSKQAIMLDFRRTHVTQTVLYCVFCCPLFLYF